MPNLAVTEVGSAFHSRRIMIVGAPLLCFLSVDELRAGIAHELGHFLGGDTRLTAFTLQTHVWFASVITTVERDAFRVGTHHHLVEGGLEFARAIGFLLVGGYSRFFLLVTRPFSRRQELAADALAATLVSPAAISSTLEKVAICGPLYDMYLQQEVGFAMKQGAMPTDLTPGFHKLRDRLLSTDKGQRFVERVRACPTDKYDTHPALLDRLRALQAHPTVAGAGDERLASALLADPVAFDAWLLEATREQMIRALLASNIAVRALQELSWSQIPDAIYAPAAKEAARRAAERLHPLLPEATTLGSMFAAVWRGYGAGKALELILRLEPAIAHLAREDARQRAAELSMELLGILFQGALLEQGATAEDSFGEPTLILRLGDERINTVEALNQLATDASGAATFTRWAERFDAARAASSGD